MMMYSILSDTHLESRVDEYKVKEQGKLLLLGGDVCTVANSITLANFLARCKNNFEEVVYVAGNHEFYGYEYYDTLKQLRSLCKRQGVHFLNNEVVEIEGQLVVGATLWSDLSNPINALYAERGMNDYRTIRLADGKLSVAFTNELHWESREFIQEHVEEGCIILTHHAPSMLSVDKRWKASVYTPAFASNIPELLDMPSCTWVHGHTHCNSDYYIGNVHVLAQPVGYAWEHV